MSSDRADESRSFSDRLRSVSPPFTLGSMHEVPENQIRGADTLKNRIQDAGNLGIMSPRAMPPARGGGNDDTVDNLRV